MPHVSLAYEDVNRDNVGRVMERHLVPPQSPPWGGEVLPERTASPPSGGD
jgi:hypothetical protein